MKKLIIFIICICMLAGCDSSLPANNSTTPVTASGENTPVVPSETLTPSVTPSPSPSETVPTATPEPTPAPTEDLFTPKVTYSYMTNTDPSKYYILLDLNNQIMTVYEKDGGEEYTKIVRQMLCSTGKTAIDEALKLIDPENKDNVPKPTARGIYKTGGHELFGKFPEFSGTYARYWTQIVANNFMHSIMFSKQNVNSLQSSPYRNIGRNVSHGCVRMYVEDAQWMYYNIPPGTTINVSDKEKRNSALKKTLKKKMSFSEYNKYQKTITDQPMPPNLTATVIVDKAKLLNGCGGTNDRLYARMKIGSNVEILLPSDPWCKVKYGNRVGYTLTANLKPSGGIIVSGNVESYTSGEDAKTMTTTSVMYTAPDEKSAIICKIPKYESLRVLEDTNGWSKVLYFNEIGYMQDKYIKTGWGIVYN